MKAWYASIRVREGGEIRRVDEAVHLSLAVAHLGLDLDAHVIVLAVGLGALVLLQPIIPTMSAFYHPPNQILSVESGIWLRGKGERINENKSHKGGAIAATVIEHGDNRGNVL